MPFLSLGGRVFRPAAVAVAVAVATTTQGVGWPGGSAAFAKASAAKKDPPSYGNGRGPGFR